MRRSGSAKRARPSGRARRQRSRHELLLAAGLALGLAAVAAVIYPLGAHPSRNASAPAQIGGPFDLVDQTGRRVTDRDLLGKPTLIAFGFTTCPDVCPMTLTHMTSWLRALGPAGDRLNVIYVTVDPERDTPQQLRAYLSAFDPRIKGLTGAPEGVDQIAREYRVFHQKVPLAGGGYTVDHATTLYLMDAKGRFVRPLRFDQPDAEALPALRRLAG